MLLTDRIKSIITDKNTTFTSLERELNLGHGTIRKWDTSSPSTDKILKIAKYFNVSVDWLLTGEGEMYKQTVNIQPKFYDNEELNVEEEILLETYKNSDRQTKKEILTFVVSKTFNFKSPKSKLSTYENGKVGTTKEKIVAKQRIAC